MRVWLLHGLRRFYGKPKPFESRYFMAASVRTGHLFELTISEVDAYDIAAAEWRTYPQPIPTPRAGTMTVRLGAHVVVLGGESGVQEEAHDEAEALSVSSGDWKTLPPLRTGRHGAGAVIWNGAIHACAGCARRGGSPELNSTEKLALGALKE